MNENAARVALLVRAVELTDAEERLLTPDDRRQASRTAAELARWQAADGGEAAAPDLFVAHRAELLAGRLAEREPVTARAERALAWRPWIGIALPLLALIAGAAFEQIADRRHLNILAFPLLGLLVWNVAVYVALLIGGLASMGRRASGAPARESRNWWSRLAQRAIPSAAGARSPIVNGALGTFAGDWAKRSMKLNASRAARVLHLSAALFAIGALAGLYVRGLVFDYRAGWESTFLSPTQVHAILAFFLAPAARLAAMPFPSVEAVAAIRFAVDPAVGGTSAESAARWIHLYAITIGLVVIAPRLLLAGLAGWRERRLTSNFPLSLDEPYFRRLTAPFARGPARMRVMPYSYTVDEVSEAGLRRIALALLGDRAEIALRPSVAYGAESAAVDGLDLSDARIAANVALFSLAATPETENHGAFLDVLKAVLQPETGARPLLVVIDESGYRRRLGAQSGVSERLDERRSAWMTFCAARGLAATCTDLTNPDLAQVERDLGVALSAIQ